MLTRFRPPDKPNSAVLVRVGSREHLRDILVTNLREWPIQTPESLPGYCHSDCLSHSDWRLLSRQKTQSYLDWQIPHDEVEVHPCQELLLHLVFPGFVLVRKGFSPTQNLVKENVMISKQFLVLRAPKYFEHILLE